MSAKTLPLGAILLPVGFRLKQYVSSKKGEGKAIVQRGCAHMRRYFRIQKEPMVNVEQYIQQNKLSETMGSISAQTESPNKRRLYVCQDASTWGNIAPRRIPLKAICQLEEWRGQGHSSARVYTHAAIFQNSKTTHDKCGAIHTTKQIKRDGWVNASAIGQ